MLKGKGASFYGLSARSPSLGSGRVLTGPSAQTRILNPDQGTCQRTLPGNRDDRSSVDQSQAKG